MPRFTHSLPWITSLLLVLLFPATLQAGAWGISPIRVDFDGSSKTAALRLDSTDPEPLEFQVRLMRWTQNESGVDEYHPSEELLYFPRAFTLPPGEQRVIRIGTKAAAPQQEMTFRLFVEELPPRDDSGQGTQIAVRLRFGVPIFFGPARPQPAGEIRDLRVIDGQAQFKVVNTGNQQFQFETITARIGDTLLGETRGWYLLAGRQREYRIDLDPGACIEAGELRIGLSTSQGLDLSRSAKVNPDQCRP